MRLQETFIQKTIHNLHSLHKQISEAKTTTQTKVDDLFKQKTNYELDNLFKDTKHDLARSKHSRNVELKRANRNETRNATQNVTIDQQSSDLLSQLQNSDIRDTKIRNDIEPKQPGTDIATRSTDLKTTNSNLSTQLNEPTWHKVENLPGYMSSAIRGIGRQMFSPITNTDIEDIDIIANVNSSGPNTDTELQTVGSYLKKYGTRNTEAELDFNQSVLSGYRADIQIWTADDREFLTVKDHAGQYIYSWPKSDSKNFNLFKPQLK